MLSTVGTPHHHHHITELLVKSHVNIVQLSSRNIETCHNISHTPLPSPVVAGVRTEGVELLLL